MDASVIIEGIRSGNRRALARGITHIENNTTVGDQIIDALYSFEIGSQVIGITGPPGSGKSTLVDQLIAQYRQNGLTVGVLAVDPTSPFSGGAILGDRVRMLRFSDDDEVYIRSMASRGKLGGLSAATFDCVQLYQSFGFDRIIIETVGAGQSEVDIIKNSDTILVLTVPGLGDDIQILKAGIMEIADIFVVNKADLAGTDRLEIQIKNMLELGEMEGWYPQIVQTSAMNNVGMGELIKNIEDHWEWLKNSKVEDKRLEQLEFEILTKVQAKVVSKIVDQNRAQLNQILDQLKIGKIGPITAIEEIMANLVYRDKMNSKAQG